MRSGGASRGPRRPAPPVARQGGVRSASVSGAVLPCLEGVRPVPARSAGEGRGREASGRRRREAPTEAFRGRAGELSTGPASRVLRTDLLRLGGASRGIAEVRVFVGEMGDPGTQNDVARYSDRRGSGTQNDVALEEGLGTQNDAAPGPRPLGQVLEITGGGSPAPQVPPQGAAPVGVREHPRAAGSPGAACPPRPRGDARRAGARTPRAARGARP